VTQSELTARQAELVAALVAGAPVPSGFDLGRVAAAALALRRKRAHEVARAWPLLAAAIGTRWSEMFTQWAEGRAPQGSFVDGWEFARQLRDSGALPALAADELAAAEATWLLRDGAARRRRIPAIRRVPCGVVVQVARRLYRVGRRH
jgi:hypothetical protein